MYNVGQYLKGTIYNDAGQEVEVQGPFVFRTDDPEETIQDIVIIVDGKLQYIDEQCVSVVEGHPGISPRWIGKRTAKGVVIKRLLGGREIGMWFIRVVNDELTGDPKEMIGGDFQPCKADDIEMVYFFARRMYNDGSL